VHHPRQPVFGVLAPDGAAERAVDPNGILEAARRVVRPAEERGQPAEVAVDRA
jgi:hypothetical protein